MISQVMAQDLDVRNQSVTFIQPEFYLGKAVPSYSYFPETGAQTVLAISAGRWLYNRDRDYAVLLNYPSVGVDFLVSNYGNTEVLGQSYTLMPFFSITPSKKLKNSTHFRFGIGASYFTRGYDAETNRTNVAVSSKLTWAFSLNVIQNLLVTRTATMRIGVGWLHGSNGHVQLPNFGLNSFLFSLMARFHLSKLNDEQMASFIKEPVSKTKAFFISARMGLGIHELGGPDGPVGGPKKAVNVLAVGGGFIFKNVMVLRFGMGYRFYQQYYAYIEENDLPEYSSNPVCSASNIYFSVGFELLMGHVGIDTEVGVNIYKPFFKSHFEIFEYGNDLDYTLKMLFLSRLGLKLYLFSNTKSPRNNIFIGAHINGNFGQADFSEVSIGYVHRLVK